VRSDLDRSWEQLRTATPPGWLVGQPWFRDELDEWEQHAYDSTEPPRAGKRVGEWTALAPTEVSVVVEMARYLGELAKGRWPS
jgi:hypothetical protein